MIGNVALQVPIGLLADRYGRVRILQWTVAWFAARGVELKTEPDGRMFPVTNTSQTIIDCLMRAATAAGVKLRPSCGLVRVAKGPGGFQLTLTGEESMACERLLLATGGCRAAAAGELAVSLGHTL